MRKVVDGRGSGKMADGRRRDKEKPKTKAGERVFKVACVANSRTREVERISACCWPDVPQIPDGILHGECGPNNIGLYWAATELKLLCWFIWQAFYILSKPMHQMRPLQTVYEYQFNVKHTSHKNPSLSDCIKVSFCQLPIRVQNEMSLDSFTQLPVNWQSHSQRQAQVVGVATNCHSGATGWPDGRIEGLPCWRWIIQEDVMLTRQC